MKPGMIVLPLASYTFAPAGRRQRARRADRRDAVARDEDVGVLEDVVALHRDDARAAQQERAVRRRRAAPSARSRSSRTSGRATSWTFSFSFSAFSFSVSGVAFFASSCLAFSSALRRSLARELDRRRERQPVERVGERPRDRLAAVGPAHVAAGVVGEAVDRDARPPSGRPRAAPSSGRPGTRVT